jgi:glutathione synthase/RimK-type ligase-like ATP-grasp enzyme
LRRTGRWHIHAIKPEHLQNFSDENALFFADALNQYLSKRWRDPKSPSTNRFDLAVLYNPSEALAPSDKRALERFVKAGRKLDVNVELIERKDYGRLGEYDALFIRETTNIDHYTYRFSKKAASEGMVVIDDPNSIVRCTNKVYLAELLAVHNIPAPKTIIIQKQNHTEHLSLIETAIGYPVVLKIPDGSFSRGVFKAESRRELEDIASKLFRESDLILAQEFVYTLFDWRIGMLNRKPIYACQYFMIKEHWQIMKHDPSGKSDAGRFKTLAVADVPAAVINAATAAAGLIGDGLYGVDLKQSDKGVFVIEVNDNPNIESGVEDAVLGDDLYRIIMEEFVRRIELRRAR